MTAPQSVTERYVSNLLHYGRNKEFDIVEIHRKLVIVEGTQVGVYFEVTVGTTRFSVLDISTNEYKENVRTAAGATVQQAIRRALTAHGVTFR